MDTSFGNFIRTDSTELLTFREFPFLRQFRKPENRAQDRKPFIEHLNKSERKAVENWRNPGKQLQAIHRNNAVYASLHSLGVFELSVEVPDDESPIPPQEAAFNDFVQHEEEICARITDALLRYYQRARQTMPDAFEYLDPEERPDNPTAEDLTRLIEFDGMTICRGSANGISPLLFHWDPIWDEEHGLNMLLYRGQVIMLDSDASDLLTENAEEYLEQLEEYGWSRKQMNSAEKKALNELLEHFEPVPND